MMAVLDGVAGFLLLTLALGLLRIWLGPSPADRMLSAQLMGTTGVALLVVLAQRQAMPALFDVALVLVVLAVLASTAFVARVRRPEQAAYSDDGPADDL